jgi:DNA-binding GntR family transcriptional regulator
MIMKLPNLIKDNSISEVVYQSIYKQILSGKLRPNDRLTEQAISESMGISRAPVREALKRLAEDRLIVLKPRSGCFVADLPKEEIEEIYEIRKRLESMAMEFAFENLNLENIKDLKKQFSEAEKLKPHEMVKMEVKLDAKLHGLIIEKANCPNLKEMLEKLRARVEVFRIKEANYTQRAKKALKEHMKILNAIISGNMSNAVDELHNHIENTKNNVLNTLEEK